MDKKMLTAGLMGAMAALGADPSLSVGRVVRTQPRPARNPKSVSDRIREVKTLEELTALLAEIQRYPNVKGKTLKRWTLEVEAAKKRIIGEH